MTGSNMGRYRILAKLGQGGMGVVYKAEDTILKRMVALKFLPPALKMDESRRQRFVQEATAASSLDHPNICTIHEVSESPDGQMYIAMAHYEGETVKEVIRRGPVPLNQAVEIAIQTAQGLAKAHQQGVTHRDVKPANLMWTRDGLVKILDFGLARKVDDTRLTQTGQTVGTLAYMSPEQVCGEVADERTDIWALGVVMYEMLTGRLPFRHSVMQAIVKETPEPISRARGDVPPELETIVSKAMEKRAEDRYQRMAELLSDLQDFKHNRPRSSSRTRTIATMVNKPPPAIAVLPFQNMSSDKENEYFSDGLTEELISVLAQVQGLRVVSRSSVFEFKGKAQNIQKVGALLRVTSVLEGSVRKMGDRVRINVQLTNVIDGYQVWSERYDREMKDVFAVQDEIARAIVKKVKTEFSTWDSMTLVKRYTDNIEAYHLYLKGRYHWNQMTAEGFHKALQFFQQALVQDPEYSMAYSGIADYYAMLAFWGIVSPHEAWPKAREAALKALEIDDTVAEAHSSLAYVRLFYDWDFPQALEQYEKALEFQPGCPQARQGYALYLMQAGQTTAAIAKSIEARNCDPLSPFLNTLVAWSYYYARRFDEALEECQKVLDLSAGYFEVYIVLGLVYEQKQQYDAAIEALENARARSQGSALVLGVLGSCLARAGRKAEALKVLEELTAMAGQRYVAPISFAMLHTGFGENDPVFEWLERAVEVRDGLLGYIGVFPIYDPFRSDPRFADLKKKIGLPEREAHAG